MNGCLVLCFYFWFLLMMMMSVPLRSAWIKVEQLKPYHPHKEEMLKSNKGKRFQQAVDAVEEFLKKGKGKEQVSVVGLSIHTSDTT